MDSDPAPGPLGYLFERFPSFTQTFCAREVAALRRAGVECPVFSIRDPRGEPLRQPFEGLGETTYLPASFDDRIAGDTRFRREARAAQADLRALWGDESEKHRIYESLWLERACAGRGVKHLHAHFAGIAARTAFWLRRRGGPTYSVTAHANDIFRDEPPERLAQILESASFVVTVSDFSRRFLTEKFPQIESRLHRVYNGIQTGLFVRSDFPPGRPLIVAVGRTIEKKGFEDLVAACALLPDIDFECQIIGGGPLDETLNSQVEAAGLGHRVVVAGPKSEDEIKAVLARARVFALPCITAPDGAMDNLPTVIVEAMAAGLPVISTPVAGIPEMVEDSVSGFLVPERSPEALAPRLRELLSNATLARQMGEAGRLRCRRLFDIATTSGELLALFQRYGALAATD